MSERLYTHLSLAQARYACASDSSAGFDQVPIFELSEASGHGYTPCIERLMSNLYV